MTETKYDVSWVGALVQWLWDEAHNLKGVGLNISNVYCMDILHIDL